MKQYQKPVIKIDDYMLTHVINATNGVIKEIVEKSGEDWTGGL